jgi:iron-sulfur cluster repair protein YtfE (RIC family)
MAFDVVDLIMQDHREAERLFNELETRPDKRPNLTPVLTTLLIAHSRAEEAEVYPVAREEADEAEEIAHGQEEHSQVDALLKRLAGVDPESAEFGRVLTELAEAVNRHVQEEEAIVLPALAERLSDARRAELGEAFAASRKQHLGEQPDELTKDQLQAQARNLGLAGVSGMSKEELKRKTMPS